MSLEKVRLNPRNVIKLSGKESPNLTNITHDPNEKYYNLRISTREDSEILSLIALDRNNWFSVGLGYRQGFCIPLKTLDRKVWPNKSYFLKVRKSPYNNKTIFNIKMSDSLINAGYRIGLIKYRKLQNNYDLFIIDL